MKKNSVDEYISNLKPLAEQEPKTVATRNLPMRVKKPANRTAKYFRYAVGTVLSAFFTIFIVNIIQSNRRSLDERYQNTDIVKKPEQKKKVVVVKRQVRTKPAPITTPGKSVEERKLFVASASSVRTPVAAMEKKVPVAAPESEVKSAVSVVRPTPVQPLKTAVTHAVSPKKAGNALKTPIGSSYTHSIPEFFPRPYKPMILALNPRKAVPAPPKVQRQTVVASIDNEEKVATTFETTPEAKKAKKLWATDTKPEPRPAANRPTQQQPKTIAVVTKTSTPVIEKPLTTPVVETPKKIPVSLQVSKLPPDERMAKAKQLFDQQQWYDACDIYRKEMYNGGHNKSRRHEAVVRAAQCYYKLGYKNTADHLLEAVIEEGGSWKKEARAILEANK